MHDLPVACYQRCTARSGPGQIKTYPMKKNMGNPDRIIRFVIAAVFIVLYISGTVTGTAGLVLLVLAGVFILTSLTSFCPIYAPFGISTCPKKG
jgi:hypothetical protein